MAYELTYRLINNGEAYEVSGYTGTPDNIVIPSEYNGLPLTSIGDEAFYNCSSLTSVVIGDSVSTIGEEAFRDCRSLTSVVLEGKITGIDYEAFSGCSNLKEVSFLNCTEVPELSAREIWSESTMVDEPEEVYSPFDNTPSDLQILVPKPLYEEWVNGDYGWVYGGWYDYTDNIVAVDKKEENWKLSYNLLDDNTYEITGIGTFTGKELIIPKTYKGRAVTSIGGSAFYDCESLTSVVIPDSVTSIGDWAFEGCYSLTSVIIGKGVTTIAEEVFFGCDSLTSITLLSKTPADISSETFATISVAVKFYCYSSALQNYQTATNWNVYADNFIADDLRLYFTMNAIAQKNYFASKEELKTLKENINKNESAVQYNENGSITVSKTPIADTDAASKAYVETYCDNIETNLGNRKLDKDTTKSEHNQVYAKTDSGNQAMVDLSKGVLANSVVQRRVDSQIRVPEEPIHNQDATSKLYVDTKVSQVDTVSCTYYDVIGGVQTPIKGEGYYMVYSDNANLKLCKSDGSVVVEGAKQMQFILAIQDKYPTGSYKACGQYWTGSSYASSVEGFRRAVDRAGYIECPTDYSICVMYKI